MKKLFVSIPMCLSLLTALPVTQSAQAATTKIETVNSINNTYISDSIPAYDDKHIIRVKNMNKNENLHIYTTKNEKLATILPKYTSYIKSQNNTKIFKNGMDYYIVNNEPSDTTVQIQNDDTLKKINVQIDYIDKKDIPSILTIKNGNGSKKFFIRANNEGVVHYAITTKKDASLNIKNKHVFYTKNHPKIYRAYEHTNGKKQIIHESYKTTPNALISLNIEAISEWSFQNIALYEK